MLYMSESFDCEYDAEYENGDIVVNKKNGR